MTISPLDGIRMQSDCNHLPSQLTANRLLPASILHPDLYTLVAGRWRLTPGPRRLV